MKVREIKGKIGVDNQYAIETFLRKQGYSGLFTPGECGCEIGNLFPCDGDEIDNCTAGYRADCDPANEACRNDHDTTWHIQRTKPTSEGAR